MSENVEPEEVAAILEATAPRPGVTPSFQVERRDFAEPRRLSEDVRRTVAARLRIELKNLEQDLKSVLRETHEFDLAELREVSAQELFDDLALPLAMARFEVAGQIGWIQWEVVPAIRTIEVVLGAPEPPETDPRTLSPVEGKVLLRILSAFATRLGNAVGAQVEKLATVDQLERIGTWREGKPEPDPQRMLVGVGIDGPAGPSTLRLFLPGAQMPAAGRGAAPAAPPEHLEVVDLEISARLGSADIPLGELLSLEVGDVIPLATGLDELLSLWTEGRLFARGRLGSKAGSLAVALAEFVESEEES